MHIKNNRKDIIQNDQSLIAVQEYLAEILENLPNAVFIKDAKHLKFVYVNKSEEQIVNLTREEMIGKSDYDFFPKEQADFFTSKDRSVLEKGELVDIKEEPIDLGTGERKWLHTKKIPIYDQNNKPLFLLGISEDVTKRKDAEDRLNLARKEIETKLNETQNIFKVILDNTADGFITTDVNGTIQTYNLACTLMFGHETKEAILFNIEKLIPTLGTAEFSKRKQALENQKDKTITIEGIEGLRKDGTTFPIELTLKQLEQESAVIYFWVIRDLTDKIASKKERENYLQNLEAKNRELKEFTYIASHDLKGPLRGIHNYAYFLLEDYEDKFGEDGQKMLRTLTKLTQQLEQYIDTLLHYSRLARNEISVEITDMNMIVKQVSELYLPEIRDRKVDFKVNKLPSVLCDSVKIAEVINNLINNALKYTDSQNVKIEIGCLDNHPDHPNADVFFVKDNGIGVKPEYHDKIFKIFKRLHPGDDYGGGSGSGLTISRRIIHRHGGKIWIESDGDKTGSTILFSLPKHVKGNEDYDDILET